MFIFWHQCHALLTFFLRLPINVFQQGADVNLATNWKRTPVFQASHLGDTKMLHILLDHSADVNITDRHGVSPLMTTTKQGHVACTKLLLRHNASVNAVADNGLSVVLHAALGLQPTCLSLILKTGVQVPEKLALLLLLELRARGSLAQNDDKVKVAKLLHAAGCKNAKEIVTIENIDDDDDDSPGQNLWPKTEGKVDTLSDLSVFKIRDLLTKANPDKNLFQSVELLPLPEKMKSILLHFVELEETLSEEDKEDMSMEETLKTEGATCAKELRLRMRLEARRGFDKKGTDYGPTVPIPPPATYSDEESDEDYSEIDSDCSDPCDVGY